MTAPGLARRRLVTETLDVLDPGDPRAIASRRDLARINAVMLAPAILAGLLRRHCTAPPRRIMEIGCGDGTVMLKIARRLAPAWPGVAVTLVDRQSLVTARTRAAFAALGWRAETVTADALAALRDGAGADIAVANLVLHHFEDAALARLFAALAPAAGLVVAAEPLRTRAALAGARSVALLGANAVTRHDAAASVRAGFRAGELAALWPAGAGAVLEDRARGPFTHVFAARGGRS